VATNGVLNIEGSVGVQGPLTNAGTVNWQGGNIDVVFDGHGYFGEIWNEAGAVWNIQCDMSLSGDSGQEAFNNAGAVTKNTTSGRTVFTAALNNSGTVEVQSGTIQLDHGGSLGASLIADAGAALNLTGGYFTVIPGLAVSGAGAVMVTGGTLDLSQVTSPISNLQLDGGEAVVTGPSFTLTNTVTSANLTINGTLLVGAGGVLDWSGGEIAPGGSLTVATNGVLNIEGSVGVQGPLTNAGTVNWQGGNIDVVFDGHGYFGEIWNEAGAVWNIQCDMSLSRDSGQEAFNNAGAVTKNTTSGTTVFTAALNNSGLLDAENGTISLNGGFDLTGGILSFGVNNLTNYGQIYLAANPSTLDGSISAHLNGGYVPATNDSFQLLSYPSFTGSFTNTNLPSLAVWDTAYAASSLSITVLQLVPTITWADPSDSVYGTPLGSAQLDAAAASPASLGVNLPGTFTYNPPLGTVLDAGSNQTLTVTFTPTDSIQYARVTNTVYINVQPAPLTVTANNTSKIYGAAVPTLTASYSGFVNGDTVASLTTPVTLATIATAASPVGHYTITASGAVDANYTITEVNGTLTVNPAALTITANNANKIYGAALPAFTASYSGFVNDDTATSLTTPATLATSATAGSPVGSYTITASGAVDVNYSITFANGTLTVNPAALTITANNTNKFYGAALPIFTASYTGFVNGDAPASLTTPVTLSTTATAASPVGHYSVTASGALDANYTITEVNGTLTVLMAAPVLTWTNPASIIYGTALGTNELNAAANTTGTFAYHPTNGAVLYTGSNTLSVVFTPTDTVDYTSATDTVSLVVLPAPLTVTAVSVTRTYGEANPVFTGTILGVTNGDNITATYNAATTASSPVGTYAITPSLVDPENLETNYTITFTNGTLTVNPAALRITANNETKYYGQAFTFTGDEFTANGLQNFETVGSVTLTSAGAAANASEGSYSIVPTAATGGTFSPGNYSISYQAGTLTVLGLPTLQFDVLDKMLVLSWTTNAVGFSLQSTTNLLSPGSWTPVSGVVVLGDQNIVTNAMSWKSAFYRLELKP